MPRRRLSLHSLRLTINLIVVVVAVPAMAETPDVASTVSLTQPANANADSKAPHWLDETRPPRSSVDTFRSLPVADLNARNLVAKTLVATTGLSLACLVVLWVSRRFSPGRKSSRQGASMALLDSLQIAPRCCLQLVSVEHQRFLIARDANGLQSVTPVNTFADTFDDITAPTAVAKERLDNASGAGLSLENLAEGAPRTLSRTRKDSWPTSLRNRQ